MTRVKVCGITNVEDARLAVDAGADALGLIFAESPRKIDVETARLIAKSLPPMVTTVGVFVDPSLAEVSQIVRQAQLDVIQLHGDEPPDFCEPSPRRVIKRFNILESDTADTLRERMSRYSVSGYLLDPGAGDGRVFDWTIIARPSAATQGGAGVSPVGSPAGRLRLRHHLIVSGGLNADNVGEAIRVTRPYAVDVCSGVESEPGRKDLEKVRAFIRAVRKTDAELNQE